MKKILSIISLIAVCFSMLTGCGLLSEETVTPTPTGTLTELPTATSTEILPPEGVDNYIDEYYAASVKVTDPNGVEYNDNGSGDLLDILLSITKNAERTVYLGMSVDASKYYKAEFDGPAGPVTYKFYFCSSPDDCYFESGSGRFYKSNPDGCRAFFASGYSEGAYSEANYPVFKINGNVVAPSSLEWQYKRTDGEYKSPDVPPVLKENCDLGSISANFITWFSIQPTRANVVVKDKNGNELYNGSYENISGISLSEDVYVDMIVDAVWEENEKSNCKGRAIYTIKAKLGAAAVFKINKSTVTPGEFLVITCPNASVDVNAIKVTFNPSYDFEPVFFSDGEELKALVPIPLLTTIEKNMVINVSAYGNTTAFNVNIKARTPGEKVRISMVSKDTIDKVGGVIEDPYKVIYAMIEDELKKNTTFSRIYPHEGFENGFDEKLRASFGDIITYSKDTSGKTYVAHDYSWGGDSGDRVKAVADGKVVYIGEQTYTGGLVIVDHGMGLLSWYWNLNTTTVSVYLGQSITKGTTVGRCGGGGLTETYNNTNMSVHIGVTVFDVPIDIEQLM